MTEKFEPDPLREKVLARRTRWLVWVEALVILSLLVWVSLEYENNAYLQSWLGGYVGPLGFLLNGTLAGLYAGALVGYSIAVFMSRRSEEDRILESLMQKHEVAY